MLKKSFTLDYKGKKVNYLLDSVLIRDVKQIHFCGLITCNGKEFGLMEKVSIECLLLIGRIK